MPYVRTWSEELLTEWYSLRNYLVKTNVPVRVSLTKKGGRYEIDLIAINYERKEVDIVEVTVGVTRFKDLISGLSTKINIFKESEIAKQLKRQKIKTKYKLIFLYAPSARSRDIIVNEIKSRTNITIEVLELSELLPSIIADIKRWRRESREMLKSKRGSMIPESLYLLKLLEYIINIRRKARENIVRSLNVFGKHIDLIY